MDIAGAIASAVVMAVGAALWDTAFAPLWALSPWRFVLACVMAALVGAGITCSIAVTAWSKRRKADAERIEELEGQIADLEADVERLTALADAEETKRLQIAEQRRRDEEAAARADAEAAKAEERKFSEKCAATYKRLTYLSRPALKVMVERGEVCLGRKYLAGYKVEKDMGPLPRLGEQTVDGDVARIVPDERARGVYEAGARELALISDGDLEEFAVYDPERMAIPGPRNHYDHVTWWFYSDDPEYDRDAAWQRRMAARPKKTGSTELPPMGAPW